MDTAGKNPLELEKERYLEMKRENAYINRILKSGYNSQPKYAMAAILSADCKGTSINKDAPYPDEDQCINGRTNNHFLPTKKLIVKGSGDWDFLVVMVKSSHFATRKDFDEIMLERSRSSFGAVIPKEFSNISLVEAFKHVSVTISPNIEYILSSATEEQKDSYQSNFWQFGKEKTEKRILNSLLLQLFGRPAPSDVVDYKGYEGGFKELTVYDFHLYYEDGNATYGTARHGEYYLFMQFYTS